ncbi:four helix bundle protein [Hymenobacter sp. BT175]|uniref:four helix bundle protein n=1 Tax=Hymenobacter translucens TaxID=2886507 RepID=UPI001D0DFA8E|nr:four helix bundle protein [Hymenobacter translucens]MCC2545039.1 four helix bundle protein [Hymenobacter translucens]
MFDFRKLRIWQEGQELTLSVYRLTRSFPPEELFGLTSQLRRSAASAPHNIAEGCGRQSAPDFLRFLTFAMGSASELESQLLLAQALEYLPTSAAEQLLSDVVRLRKMMTVYYQKVKASQ